MRASRLRTNARLERRRWIVGLSMLGGTIAQIVTLYSLALAASKVMRALRTLTGQPD